MISAKYALPLIYRAIVINKRGLYAWNHSKYIKNNRNLTAHRAGAPSACAVGDPVWSSALSYSGGEDGGGAGGGCHGLMAAFDSRAAFGRWPEADACAGYPDLWNLAYEAERVAGSKKAEEKAKKIKQSIRKKSHGAGRKATRFG